MSNLSDLIAMRARIDDAAGDLLALGERLAGQPFAQLRLARARGMVRAALVEIDGSLALPLDGSTDIPAGAAQ